MSTISRNAILTLAAAVAVTATACKTETPPPPPPAAAIEPPPPPPPPADPATITYGPDLKIDITKLTKLPSGVYYRDDVKGKGATVTVGKTVSVHYVGHFSDGSVFEEGDYKTTIPGQVINGWNEGIPGMKVGGTRTLVIPSSLGYGDTGQGKIPGGVVLVFVITLKEVS